MIRGENSDSIPNDLIIEILSRLPAKSILRFRCVSKRWGYMLRCPYFTDLFRTRSYARPPRLLFAVGSERREWRFYSSPQPQNLYDEKSSSLVVTADFHTKFHGEYSTWLELCGHAHGLISSRPGRENNTVICNSSTGQYVVLSSPKGTSDKRMGWGSYLGFDPIGKQFKVLSLSFPRYDKKFAPVQILTLGSGKHSWRKIHCPIIHFPWYDIASDAFPEGICINGVLYYVGAAIDDSPYMIVCFDVRSEKFKFIYREFIIYRTITKLVNYKGKLGVITLTRGDCPRNFLCMWVIKDVEKPKPEWSESFSFRWDNEVLNKYYNSIVGVTTTGEIVLSLQYVAYKPFYVFYLNPERKTFQSVEIRGFEATHGNLREVKVFLDRVEDLQFIPTDAATSTSSRAPMQQDQRGAADDDDRYSYDF